MQIEIHGVRGMNSTPFWKTFTSEQAMDKWLAKHEGDIEIHGMRKEDSPFASKAIELRQLVRHGGTLDALAMVQEIQSYQPSAFWSREACMTLRVLGRELARPDGLRDRAKTLTLSNLLVTQVSA